MMVKTLLCEEPVSWPRNDHVTVKYREVKTAVPIKQGCGGDAASLTHAVT